jgi:chromate transporter
VLALTSFFALVAALPALGALSHDVELFDAFYRSGALVFGGGHVILPLLSKAFVTPGWVGQDSFLAGYGAAQAVPGPLSTFAAYLGAVVEPSHRIGGAVLGLTGIFLPGFLLLVGTLPFWDGFRQRTGAQAIMRGINAAVVVDRFGKVAQRFFTRARRLRIAHGLAHAAAHRGYRGCSWRHCIGVMPIGAGPYAKV